VTIKDVARHAGVSPMTVSRVVNGSEYVSSTTRNAVQRAVRELGYSPNLLAADPAPTAIFASNDDMAAAVIAEAHRRGLDVPRDLTVVGFDDTLIASTIWPKGSRANVSVNNDARIFAARLAPGDFTPRRGGPKPAAANPGRCENVRRHDEFVAAAWR
jgi:DNA-binding LacI/PurR family transcriptional regulator